MYTWFMAKTMTIECGNCGKEVEETNSWYSLFSPGGTSLRCSGCGDILIQDLGIVKSRLLKAIVLSSVIAIIPIAVLVFSCTVFSGFYMEVEYFLRGKVVALLSVLLLINFILIFIGLAVPEVLRYRSCNRIVLKQVETQTE